MLGLAKVFHLNSDFSPFLPSMKTGRAGMLPTRQGRLSPSCIIWDCPNRPQWLLHVSCFLGAPRMRFLPVFAHLLFAETFDTLTLPELLRPSTVMQTAEATALTRDTRVLCVMQLNAKMENRGERMVGSGNEGERLFKVAMK